MAAVTADKPAPLADHANLLLQKFPAEQFIVTTLIDATDLGDGDRAGLVVPGRATASVQIQKTSGGLKIIRTTSDVRKKVRRHANSQPGRPRRRYCHCARLDYLSAAYGGVSRHVHFQLQRRRPAVHRSWPSLYRG